MNGITGNALAREPVERRAAAFAQREQIVGRSVAVAALHERRARAEPGDELRRCGLDTFSCRYVAARERRGLEQVRRHEVRAPDQILERPVGAPLEQRRAVARGEHRIDHDRRAARGVELAQPELHVARDVVAREHPELQRVGRRAAQDRAQLLQHHAREHRQHLVHARGVLHRERGDHAHPVHAERAEHLEVGLEAGAAGRIRSRDAERDLHGEPSADSSTCWTSAAPTQPSSGIPT